MIAQVAFSFITLGHRLSIHPAVIKKALRSSCLEREVALSLFDEHNRRPTTTAQSCVLFLEYSAPVRMR